MQQLRYKRLAQKRTNTSLAIANYHLLLSSTSISIASGVLQIQPIWTALGVSRTKALPTFHAFTGADNTGRFSGMGKTTWFKIYLKAGSDIIQGFQMLSENNEVTEDLISSLASFVCAAYCPKGLHIKSIPPLRRHLFCNIWLKVISYHLRSAL